ncbi:MAG TPA: CCA tRNA nucleotidyltransferase [Bryobacteraceae bacterium]|nr:CCA tRNA nucleotidyltransferase [Bryobacteraceae bacterium]
MAAPRQKLMKESATVVATTTLAVFVAGRLPSGDIKTSDSPVSILLEAQLLSYDEHVGRAQAIQIAHDLQARGYLAWLVGGCVRDLVLGREPKDYDIATDATPDQLLQLFPRAQLVGAQFGVILVDGVEVATFRSDHSYQDGRHPQSVTFETDPKQDVLRRDFTINALLLEPAHVDDPTGHVVDYVGGLEDLKNGVIRAIGDPAQRFEEDHLRMLRAIRFAARFGFEIEPGTFAAIREMHQRIARVSPERIRDELNRILTEGGARRGFELLDVSGLLPDILPEVAAMKGIQQPPEFHPEGDVWTHTLIMLEGLREPTPTLAWGVLLHDVGKPGTFRIAERIRFDGHVELGERIARDILARFRFSNADVDQIVALIANHMRFTHVHQMRESTLKRMLRLDRFTEHLELHRLDCVSSHGNVDNYQFVKSKFEQAPAEVLRPARLVTGDDLIAAGYRPGPDFSRMLEAAEDAQLESRIETKEQGLELIHLLFGPQR